MQANVERQALVVGLTLVPGFVSRNRSFSLFEDPEVRRARRRAGMLRGIVRQLTGAHGQVEDISLAYGADGCELRYRLPAVRVERRASMSLLEVACVRYLASRAGVAGLQPTDEDRAGIDGALRMLAAGLRLATLDAP